MESTSLPRKPVAVSQSYTERHLSYGIAQCYLSPDTGKSALL